MNESQKLCLKRMGVMNFTPDSFSDGGELSTPGKVLERLNFFGSIDALDIGAESTAPQNDPVDFYQELKRLEVVLPMLKRLECAISIDTYHPETIFKVAELWKSEGLKNPLIWNDVSGKFDQSVKDFLKLSPHFHYVLCHNLAPIRELSSSHMDYLSLTSEEDFLDELASFFRPYIHPRVIFDPCLGFSKNYEQNWYILNHFEKLQRRVPHLRWLLGFSRKSFLRIKYGISSLKSGNRQQLDECHLFELSRLLPKLSGEIWIRTHRPELLSDLR
jgi:dihydropteroate synthase